ncbi:protein FAR1-RELATED SEQUENCE 5-like [Lathyrus oleraceus]|uniref:protein FAR1-RELATED SEQUENCE 5-like n=1 Tax=Pisum sativum TaxID=3888 RepID=UPI0021D3E9A6|nr:protein FAR1-RELATED SEQUENCE 5-like [Pisum sativum]
MSLIRVVPENILVDLKEKKPESDSNIKQVYNACYQNNMAIRGPRSEMQQLLKLLDDNQYVSRYKVCEDKFTARVIFWTHPESIKLFNTFPIILIIDSTFKTSRYRFPLLEILGVTSTENTFLAGFSFLKSKKEVKVTWVLEMCKTLLKGQ